MQNIVSGHYGTQSQANVINLVSKCQLGLYCLGWSRITHYQQLPEIRPLLSCGSLLKEDSHHKSPVRGGTLGQDVCGCTTCRYIKDILPYICDHLTKGPQEHWQDPQQSPKMPDPYPDKNWAKNYQPGECPDKDWFAGCTSCTLIRIQNSIPRSFLPVRICIFLMHMSKPQNGHQICDGAPPPFDEEQWIGRGKKFPSKSSYTYAFPDQEITVFWFNSSSQTSCIRIQREVDSAEIQTGFLLFFESLNRLRNRFNFLRFTWRRSNSPLHGSNYLT